MLARSAQQQPWRGLKTGRVLSLASKASGAGMRGGTLQVSVCMTLKSCCNTQANACSIPVLVCQHT